MEPVVDGLEEKYVDEIEVRRIESSGGAGLEAFRSYSLRGHPAYVILKPSGELDWKGLGELSSEILDKQILAALNKP